MKLFLHLFPVFLFVITVYPQEEEIWTLEENYISNFKKANHKEILSFYHSDFLGWPDSELHPADKEGAAKYLAGRYPEPTQVDYKIKREGIRILNNIAITHYLLNFSWINNEGVKQTSESRMTHTWIKDGSEWKILGGMSNSK